MKKLIPVALVLLLCLCLINGCMNSKEKAVTNEKDYSVYLNKDIVSPGKEAIEKDIEFWTKRNSERPDDMVSQIKLASLYSRHFGYSGNIEEILYSDSLYKRANELQHLFSSGLYRSLATNAITQHQFRKAQQYLDSSLRMGDDKNITWLQQFDVALELGNRLLAQQVLNDIADRKSFEYLIREARFLDHYKGDLPSAIKSMEKALDLARQSGNSSQLQWTLTNLGDMYSHANRFEDAYKTYLEVLKSDPGSHHALKGIAWLAFSHDKNTEAAVRIIKYLQTQQSLPDYYLLMSEIEGYKHNDQLKNQYLQKFVQESTKPCYGDMYNKYLFRLYTDELQDSKKAMTIALREVNKRPTPESYDLLSFALCKSGKINEARQIAEKFVKGKCFEPSAKYHLGQIAQASGNAKEANDYFKAAINSAFELGPEIAEELKSKTR